jgi:hypothetical protein
METQSYAEESQMLMDAEIEDEVDADWAKICQCPYELSSESTPLEPNTIHSWLIIIVSQQTPSSKLAHPDLGMIFTTQWGRPCRDMTGPGGREIARPTMIVTNH